MKKLSFTKKKNNNNKENGSGTVEGWRAEGKGNDMVIEIESDSAREG